jgi:cytochrome b
MKRSQSSPADAVLRPVRVWDLPTRLFHWVLAATIVGSIVSAKIGGNALVWHMRLGYVVATLLVFRLLWGFVGGYWSRFARFFPTPSRLTRYLRGAPHIDDHFEVGHSPIGALSVFAMLTLLAVQVATGLVADDEIATTGPLVQFVSSTTSLLATGWHKSWGQGLIIALILLHVGAIAFYRYRLGHRLVPPMLAGDKHLPVHVPESDDTTATRIVAAVLIAACAAAVAWVVSLGG